MSLTIYLKVNNQRPVGLEEISSSMFSSSCGLIRRKQLIYMRLVEKLPRRKENIFSGRVICRMGDRAMVGIVLPDEAESHV
jgi:hypothetical protein